jgi:hypothetical protein
MRIRLIRLLAGMSVLAVSALVAVPAGATTSLTNGNFAGSPTAPFETVWASGTSANPTAIPGWTVTQGSVDWINGYWPAPTGSPAGSLSIDMNGTPGGGDSVTAGILTQTLATDANATYVVQFGLSGNTQCGSSTQDVSVSSSGSAPVNYVTNLSADQGQWASSAYSFVATSNSTTLTFAADPTDFTNCGAVIGNVTLTETAAAGALCKKGGWQSMFEPTGVPFKNQGDCVSFYATSGATPIGS